jgi:hypothetical protein
MKSAPREGFGDTLAKGMVRAAKELGLYDALLGSEGSAGQFDTWGDNGDAEE